MELTVTQTAINVLKKIYEELCSEPKLLIPQQKVTTAPFTIKNCTGMDIKLYLALHECDTYFVLDSNGNESYPKDFLLKNGSQVDLGHVDNVKASSQRIAVLRELEQKEDRLLTIELVDLKFKCSIPISSPAKRYYPVKIGQDEYELVCIIGVKQFSKVVTLRSIVQVVNELEVPMDLYYSSAEMLPNYLGTVEPQEFFYLSMQHLKEENGLISFGQNRYIGIYN